MRRRHNRRRKNKQRKIIIFSSIGLLFIMAVGYSAFQTNLNINAKGNIVERSRVIQSWTSSSNEDFHTDYYRENIVSATFLDSNAVPSDAVESWDVSVDKDKGVMAYVVYNNEDNTKYDLYIGANKGVIANENSGYLFYKFTVLKTIDFKTNFDTSNTINMVCMFSNCKTLLNLDLSTFNTGNVTTLEDIWSSCNNITNINLRGWNTQKVINMRGLFYNNYKLESIDLSSFNTSNVTTMRAMFMGAYNLTEINLCNFNTTNVITTQDMFNGATSITKIKVGLNWTMANANTSNMFTNSGVSEVTTGEC